VTSTRMLQMQPVFTLPTRPPAHALFSVLLLKDVVLAVHERS